MVWPVTDAPNRTQGGRESKQSQGRRTVKSVECEVLKTECVVRIRVITVEGDADALIAEITVT